MTYDEIVQALRCCSYGCVCEKCPSRQDENCIDHVNVSAAAAIERLVAENAALRKSIPQWIGVDAKNQQPPPRRLVLVTDGVSLGVGYRTSADTWRRYYDYRVWCDVLGQRTTHWMPLLDLPKEG